MVCGTARARAFSARPAAVSCSRTQRSSAASRRRGTTALVGPVVPVNTGAAALASLAAARYNGVVAPERAQSPGLIRRQGHPDRHGPVASSGELTMTNFGRIAAALLAVVALASAEAETFRCVGADGKVSYSDRRCEPGSQAAGIIGSSGVRAPLPAEAAATTAPGKAGGVSGVVHGGTIVLEPGKPGPAHVLAACGTLVAHCASPTGKSLDTCFAAAPRCASAQPWLDGGSMACCPQACRERYDALRKAGKPEMQAFDQTLNGAGCVASR